MRQSFPEKLNNMWLLLMMLAMFPLNLRAQDRLNNESPSKNEKDTIVLSLTLDEAILMSMEQNQALSVERLNPTIRLTFEQQQQATFDPLLTGTLSNSSSQTNTAGTGSSVETGETRLKVGVSKPLATGTQIGMDLQNSQSQTGSLGEQASTRLGFSVTQALLRGNDVHANLASIEQSQLDTLSSEYELRGFTETLVADVEVAYWDYVLAEQQINIMEDSLKLAQQRLQETLERIKVGKLPELESAAVEAQVATQRESLINARSSLAKNQLRLLRLLNPQSPNLWQQRFILKSQPQIPEQALDNIEDHIALALKKRPELNQARLQASKGDLELVKTKNGTLPKLDLFLNLGKSGYADSFGGSFTELTGDSYDVTLGIQLDYPLKNRDAQARHERAVLTRQQMSQSIRNLEQLIQVDVRSAYIEVRRTKEQIAAVAATRRLREATAKAENEKFQVGKSTGFLIAQVEGDLVLSQISEVEAVMNHLKALVQLYRLEGSLLDRRGIQAPGQKPAE
ncbi:TolC family protein [Deltaproteobacteria bacterium TL4]